MVAKYTRRPLTVEAVQISAPMKVRTASGFFEGKEGDWLVTEENGDQRLYRPDDFEKLFESAKPMEFGE